MPGFAMELEDDKGSISKTIYFIDKKSNYPIEVKSEFYSTENPQQKTFMDQKYDDIKFNLTIDEHVRFDTTDESIIGFEKTDMKPE
jgi:urease beta subunit